MNDTKENTDFLDFLKDDFEVMQVNRHPAISEMEQHLPSISKLSLIAKNMTVEASEECSVALDVTSDIRTLNKTLEELRKRATEPYRKSVQMINDAAKGLQEILNIAENEIKVKIAIFQKAEEVKMAAAQESVKELSEKLGIDILIPDDARLMQSSKASSYYKEVTTFEIMDVKLIPDIYWIVDEKLIQRHIDLGMQDIPGIKIVKDKKFVVRRK
jgi:hypothetical protein